jgi:hypothetical protein
VKCAIGCLLLFVLLICGMLGAAGAVYWRITQPQPVSALPTPQATVVEAVNAGGTPVALAPDVSARQKLAAIDKTVKTTPSGTRTPFAASFTEAEVNAAVLPQLQQDVSFPLQHGRVYLTPGLVTVRGDFTGNGFNHVPVELKTGLSVEQGQLQADLQNVSLNGLGMPGLLRDQVSSQLQTGLRQWSTSLPMTIQHVTIGDRTLRLEGTTK